MAQQSWLKELGKHGHGWNHVWPGLNPAAEAEQRRWEHPLWLPGKYLGALPMALEVSVLC